MQECHFQVCSLIQKKSILFYFLLELVQSIADSTPNLVGAQITTLQKLTDKLSYEELKEKQLDTIVKNLDKAVTDGPEEIKSCIYDFIQHLAYRMAVESEKREWNSLNDYMRDTKMIVLFNLYLDKFPVENNLRTSAALTMSFLNKLRPLNDDVLEKITPSLIYILKQPVIDSVSENKVCLALYAFNCISYFASLLFIINLR